MDCYKEYSIDDNDDKSFRLYAGVIAACVMAMKDLGFKDDEVYEGVEAFLKLDICIDREKNDKTAGLVKEFYEEWGCRNAEDFILALKKDF